jgi:uncharacterized protein (DUF779 family)
VYHTFNRFLGLGDGKCEKEQYDVARHDVEIDVVDSDGGGFGIRRRQRRYSCDNIAKVARSYVRKLMIRSKIIK